MSNGKKNRFKELCLEAKACKACPQLSEKEAVLSFLNGSLTPKVFFIAEAPGRLGADRTRIPFFGDKSGENFQLLLDSVGLKREEIFITNAVLCSPQIPKGKNRRPKATELKNCSYFLKRQIELIEPSIIATLGSVALQALKLISHHDFVLNVHVGKVLQWNGKFLVPLYHPSPQVIISHRSLKQQIEDFQVLKMLLQKAK
ncbi:MAG: uracil-DNA glycosylase [Acidobacteriota bacterium]|nr:uracil-DNA glycosylase [Pyrinomonadaceae bacterium]MDW8304455.1 uracil-DNA glycosylase [Acidobacteriota bacterium]